MTGPEEITSDPDLGFIHRYQEGSGSGPKTTFLLLHGTGGDERDLFPLAQRLIPGANLLGVRGKVLEDGMARYFRRLTEGVFDEQDLIARAAELAAFVPAAALVHHFDADRVFALGYSNGANMAAALLLLHPHLLRGGILFRTVMPLTAPVPVDLIGSAVLLSQGERDPLATRQRADELARVLETCGATVTVKWQQSGHGLTEADLSDASNWLADIRQDRAGA
jgi:phospholipase/carboxylesterase